MRHCYFDQWSCFRENTQKVKNKKRERVKEEGANIEKNLGHDGWKEICNYASGYSQHDKRLQFQQSTTEPKSLPEADIADDNDSLTLHWRDS